MCLKNDDVRVLAFGGLCGKTNWHSQKSPKIRPQLFCDIFGVTLCNELCHKHRKKAVTLAHVTNVVCDISYGYK